MNTVYFKKKRSDTLPVGVNKHSVNVFSGACVYIMEIFRTECLIRTKPTEKSRTGVIVSAIVHRQRRSTAVLKRSMPVFVHLYKIQHKTVTNNDQNCETEWGIANSFFWTERIVFAQNRRWKFSNKKTLCRRWDMATRNEPRCLINVFE